MRKSTAWAVGGPPRAQQARPPPSRNGTSCCFSAPAACLMAARMLSNGSVERITRPQYPDPAPRKGLRLADQRYEAAQAPQLRREVEPQRDQQERVGEDEQDGDGERNVQRRAHH